MLSFNMTVKGDLVLMIKVYELRDSSWFDRGTGHCKGVYDDTQDLALIIVEAEPMPEGQDGDSGGSGSGSGSGSEGGEGEGGFLKEELLLSTKVEKEDIYARQQGTSPLMPHLPVFDRWESKWELICRYTDRLDGTPE
jgi:hypothetical protein